MEAIDELVMGLRNDVRRVHALDGIVEHLRESKCDREDLLEFRTEIDCDFIGKNDYLH